MPASEPPIRAELFSLERLEQHAESLAAAQPVKSGLSQGRPLVRRLHENARVLSETYRSIVHAVEARQSITPAAEWLLDNFHVVDEQIREIKDDLPPGFYRKLPKLADGPLEGYPRVFGMAWALVAHTDSAFELQKLVRFTQAYQRVQPLTIGELWALAITLRIMLVENLRRLSEAIAARLSAGRLADTLADKILGTDEDEPVSAEHALQLLNEAPWSSAFAVQLAQRLRDRDPNTTPPLDWLNEKLAAENTTADQIVRDEVLRQSAMNVTVRNVITSMRLVSTINWAEFFESVSPVDAILRQGGNYAAMDFQTRDLYRRAIENIAQGCGRSEVHIAQRVMAAVKRAHNKHAGSREADPGYYLLDGGRAEFERSLGCHAPIGVRLFRLNSSVGISGYAGLITASTAFLLCAAILWVNQAGADSWALFAIAIAGIIPASDVAVAIINRTITQRIGASVLPALELRDGVPPDMATMVVVPTLLTSPAAITKQIERLEIHHLANPEENFSFAILSDWRDHTEEKAPDDDQLLALAAKGISELNERYFREGGKQKFYLLHRRRLWNKGERRWMGWERKRGKLHELNRLLRGASDTNFIPVNGVAQSLPSGIRYVITLDADTRLPIGTARRLVGKIAHPLNRPVLDKERCRVVRGHAILQPRVTPSLPMGSEGSVFQHVFSGPNGLDPYALAVSDIYQDLFEEGSFCGKGIYEIDAFEASLNGRIPENAVLSHDLLEGIFARAALVSDIEVVEEYPSRYDVAAARQHRWVRGDWQLLSWIFGFGRGKLPSRRVASVPLMGRWKLLDNLRRSLSAPSTLLAFILGWLLLAPGAAQVWTICMLVTLAVPPLIPAMAGIIPKRVGVSLANHMRALREDFTLGIIQSAFLLTFLAHQAWVMVDAVVRTLFRLFIGRRRLLEWTTAAQVNDAHVFDRRALVTQITASLAFVGIVAAVMIFTDRTDNAPLASSFAALWVLSPLVARWASLPPRRDGDMTISGRDTAALRLIARRTWRFFETFVTAESNMLPPDNFQETPKPVVAQRTSPTNLGLYLLSTVAAHDFGWVGTCSMLARLEQMFVTMARMERFRGHFYNWYDTKDLRPLDPKYISSVDSGNLAGHFIALAHACRDLCTVPILNPEWTKGLGDALSLVRESLPSPLPDPLHRTLTGFEQKLRDVPEAPSGLRGRLDELAQQAAALAAAAREMGLADGEGEVMAWIAALQDSIASHKQDMDLLMPWARHMASDRLPEGLDVMPTLKSLPAQCEAVLAALTETGLGELPQSLAVSIGAARLISHRLEALAEKSMSYFHEMEFGFLFDRSRQLLSIGYRENDGSLDSNFYDLLASEARLASFIAIAKGDIPAKHWFSLGRTLTPLDGGSGLISWSGSMFEYLMPSIVMRAPSGSLLEQTTRLIVRRQEKYGRAQGVPWGISESAYNSRDIEQTYQYSSFGVPDLGYKRGLKDNLVIAPYATGLAAMIDPPAAVRNYALLQEVGGRGAYGWYEALDYTRTRVPDGSNVAIVRAYMAHHQAMTITGIANAVHDGRMRARFHAEPLIQAAELLLQERMPRAVAVAHPPPELAAATETENIVSETQRRYTSVHSRLPRSQILSNGRYSVMMTAAGSGFSRWRDIAITRWREDFTLDNWGSYIFVRDIRSGAVWSAGYQPAGIEPDNYGVTFAEDRIEVARNDGDIHTMLELVVSSEDDAEVRRVTLTNHGNRMCELELTSYAEIALARQADDLAHPVFSKMFVETEFVPSLGAILATRKQRSSRDPVVWAAHLSAVEGDSDGDVQFDTHRARFLGRGRTVRSPAAIADGWPLSNTVGTVLDPIFSLRRRVKIPPGGSARVSFCTIAAATRGEVLDLADKHHDAGTFERAATLAWTNAQMHLHHLGITRDEAHLFQRLANHVLYADSSLRPPSDVIARGLRKVSTLWAQGISGDFPIILVRVEENDDLPLIRQLLRAHEYWRSKQLSVDLVILNERAASYVQDFQVAIDSLVRLNGSMPKLAGDEVKGSVFVLRSDIVPAEIRSLLLASARVVLQGNRGTLAEQINRARARISGSALPARRGAKLPVPEVPLPQPPMEFFNGLGGFVMGGREYLTILHGSERTPLPWINVVANPNFGFQVSADGSGFTWSLNSQQNKLTPWSNDPVSDIPGEVFYVRDEVSGEVWTPTALPIRNESAFYAARHGQGYSRFEHVSHGLALELLQFVPVDDSIKIARLKIVNQSGRARRLAVTAYVEWVLGHTRTTSAPTIVTEINSDTGALFAQNPWSDQFSERVAFMDLNAAQTAWTGDRTEFLGRDGALDQPLAMTLGTILSGRVGGGLDPCGALQTHVNLSAVGATEIIFFLGQAADRKAAQDLVTKYRQVDLDAVFKAVGEQWDGILDTVQVKTPDRALDILVNRWLPYQTLACRVWARCGFYQVSGAYGFRDQLQDVMALCLSRPDIARGQILRAAGRQFAEGDVQHWWLPESGRGIRTRISDDKSWLAFVVSHYVRATGDTAVLDEPVPFLEGPALREDEHDAFFQPTISERKSSLYEHCALALDASFGTGVHGLPLMGTGDWNDGMDRVGQAGKGESIWLGWFQYAALNAFSDIAAARDRGADADRWRTHAKALQAALEKHGWDGDWYRRAYFDDGTPLGSVSNNECRIDSIAQSWGVISGGASPQRAARAMAAVNKYLVRRDEKLSLLFAPPFVNPTHDPGYIKGYPAGIRENGGQYTHGAVWAALAFVMQGDGDRAGELLAMMNPINHGSTRAAIQRYKVEPYVICADVYSIPPHVGRGGWTWYTGSAGWMYNVTLERFLGIRLHGDRMLIDPCIPRTWPGFEASVKYRSSRYEISVENPLGVSKGVIAVKLDGTLIPGEGQALIPLSNDGRTHHVQVVLG